jgi:hypothetical protein
MLVRSTLRRAQRHGTALVARALLGCAIASCSAPHPPAAQPSAASPARIWDYRVRATGTAHELSIEAELPPGVPAELGVDAFAHPFLVDLQIATDAGGWQPLARSGRRWRVPRCQARGCRLRYRYDLGRAAEHIDRFAYAGYRAGALLAPPSTFLLAPQDYVGDDLYRFSVEAPRGEHFVTGLWRDAGSGRYAAPASVLFQAPYSAFGRFERESLRVGGGLLHVVVAPGEAPLRVQRAALRAAVSSAARAVSDYYGHFPVPEATLIVLPSPGATTAGMQLGNGGASIVYFLGVGVDDETLARDWVMTHELLHLGFPTLGRRHRWLAEGLATYQEPIARARAGLIDEPALWGSFLRGMPQGLPHATDGGLEGSASWGRTYWGGALFCLLVDVQIRTRTNNRLSLDDVARSILRGGGDTSVRWSVQDTLAAGDRALDRPTLSELHAEHAARPVSVDVEALFRRLGVRRDGAQVSFDETAELAAVRRAISRHGVERTLDSAGPPSSK